MGRKSLQKERKAITPKVTTWVRELFPLLQDRALDNLSLDEISSLTGRSKSTIYTYFSTKEEIIDTTVGLILNDLEATLYIDFPKTENMEAAYRFMLVGISDGLSGMSIRFLDEIKLHFSEVWNTIHNFINKMLDTFRSIYERGMASGQFAPFSIELLMAMDTYFVISIMTDTARFKEANLSLDDLVTQYLELRIKGMIGHRD